ncbi:hypothetical protein BG015_002735 [Linnemannia schmuckeri]|uniref:Uncharacterized protein n=1 Tax=Linnemannia schmuckeri TaxID=64567 RepID=A0A9P5RNN1_9FUNG|nr:hypothetical protein BG015_002735 [Linnemannia schmuckeri]
MGQTDEQKLEYQTVRLKKGEFHPGLRKVSWTEFRVPIFPDNVKTGRKVVLWDDILLFVPKATQLQVEEADLAFCVDMDCKELQPIRFEARPDHIIDVVG